MTEELFEEELELLLKWWQSPKSISERPSFGAGFYFDSGAPSDSDWFWWVEQKPDWQDVKILQQRCVNNFGVVIFEGKDPATNLRMRISWFVEFGSDGIAMVVETGGFVTTRDE